MKKLTVTQKSFIKRTAGDYIFETINVIIMILLLVVTMYPILNTLAYSFSDGLEAMRTKVFLTPVDFTWRNYQKILAQETIYQAAYISVMRTLVFTGFSLISCTMLAYTLTRNKYMFRKSITIILIMTMYVDAGLIPTYFLYRNLGLVNSFWVYIWPMLINPFWLIIIRTYMKTIPESLIESAKLDGAGEFRIYIQIIMPLCKPVLATMSLFMAVWAWNSWYDTYLYAPGKQNLSTLQFELKKLITTANPQAGSSVSVLTNPERVTPKTLKAAITIVTSLPIVMVYPFLQKHFVAGLSVGSVKG